MLRVALTGGVGSGKSAAAAMLREFGADISQSDEVGRALMQPGAPAFLGIVQHFGQSVVAPDGSLDRAALARIAFDDGRVEEINAIVHPLVLAAQSKWAAAVAVNDPLAVAVVESALIFETKHAAAPQDSAPWRTRFDRIVVLTAPVEIRRQRYMARLPWLSEEAASADFHRRAAAQWTDERKSALADFAVVNDGSLQHLREAMAPLWDALKTESARRAAETA